MTPLTPHSLETNRVTDDALGQFTALEIRREDLHALMARSDGPGLARAA